VTLTADAPILEGRLVRLEPLSVDHVPDLVDAAGSDRSTFRYTWVPGSRAEMEHFVSTLLHRGAKGEQIPFAQIRVDSGRAVGSTSFLNFRRAEDQQDPYAVEIGHTWLGPAAQGTGINTEAKLLLLTHAFERWGAVRVDVKTDVRNERSRRAIERMGARFEGVLRRWQPSYVPGEEGRLRDTAMYSVVQEEWPAVRAGLQRRLSESEAAAG
jgi:RimJ/RimL family protein N-acetyltransferase